MRRPAPLVLAALAMTLITSCSDDAEPSNILLTDGCAQTTVTAPATAPTGPQICAQGRFLTTDATTGEDQDPSADYVSIAFVWIGAEGVSFLVTARPPIVDNVFDVGTAAATGIPGTDDSCTSLDRPDTPHRGFTTTAANGSCRVLQKVAVADGPLTFTIEVRDGDALIETLEVPIAFDAS